MMPQNDSDKPAEQQLNVELTDDVADGVYANLAMIAHSPDEFIIDFIQVMPGVPKARVKSRMIVSPQHARRLLAALADNVERYERSFGPIEERGPSEPTVRFGGPSGVA